jgi:hypothetical protein
MQTFKIGMLARAKAGHDKNKIFVILRDEEEYVYLVDGKGRTLDSPKKKNKKHIQIIKHIPVKLENMAQDIKNVNNEIIKEVITLEVKKQSKTDKNI